MTDSVIIAEMLNLGLFAEGGATVSIVKPYLEMKNCFVIGGAGQTHTGDKDYFYEHIALWVTESIYEGATHVGVWLDPETGIVHYDSLTVITYDPDDAFKTEVTRALSIALGYCRDEKAIGHFDEFGTYQTVNYPE